MAISQAAVLAALKRVKGPDLDGNIVDLGLVSEVLIKDGRVYFSITVPPERAAELEPLREAAAKVVADLDGVAGVTAVLTAETRGGASAKPAEHQRVTAARQAAAARAAPPPQPAGQSRGQALPGVKHLIAVASGKGGVGKS
ncbi:MAG: DUF59 domain-containing protein, partial [Hyphomicrobiaceae bacterium]|nr:DUF59 domain-containing protein [Hyphomicrobiaceae bacterium]